MEHNHDYQYYGVMDKHGNILFSKVNESLYEYDEDIKMVVSGKMGLVDKDGRIKSPFNYEYIGIFEKDDKLIPVKSNGKFGYINQQGETVIDFICDDAKRFEEGLVQVMQKRVGIKGYDVYFIDEKGNIVFDILTDISLMG